MHSKVSIRGSSGHKDRSRIAVILVAAMLVEYLSLLRRNLISYSPKSTIQQSPRAFVTLHRATICVGIDRKKNIFCEKALLRIKNAEANFCKVEIDLKVVIFMIFRLY